MNEKKAIEWIEKSQASILHHGRLVDICIRTEDGSTRYLATGINMLNAIMKAQERLAG